MAFLPVTAEEMRARGWEEPDFVYVTGDAYVDHPSFGLAIIWLSRGYAAATRLAHLRGFHALWQATPGLSRHGGGH